jgi:DNA-binding MarR family transcriptional regulator
VRLQVATAPVATLLSQALVAFTVEFDNEFERRMLHRTTRGDPPPGASAAPWLVSLVMWENCMRHVDDDGLTVAELARRARTPTNLDGMRRWGYITIDGRGRGTGAVRTSRNALVRPTRAGRLAQQTWRPLAGLIEERWRARFGADRVEQLRTSLSALAQDQDPASGLPDCLPILGYGLFSRAVEDAETGNVRTSELPLSALLSRALLSFALAYERGRPVSLAIAANILRVTDEHGQRVRDVPALTGVSKEAVQMALRVLQRARLAVVEPDPAGSRFKRVRLTSAGLAEQVASRQRLVALDARLLSAGGEALRAALLATAGDSATLAYGLEPSPGGWRAALPRPATLPHFPMVLHRGGFPDGS